MAMQSSQILYNKTRGNVVAARVVRADTFWRRLRGLMGRTRLDFPTGTALVITPCKQVHTFFMCFAIDVLFVDADFHVVQVLPQLRPNRVSPHVKSARRVIELPPGTIAASGITRRDMLAVIEAQSL